MNGAEPAPIPVRIPRRAGRPLFGDLHLPPGEPGCRAVLIVHGFKGFKDWGFWPPAAERLAGGGIAALRFNLSGSGILESGDRFDDPEGFEANTYGRELDDIAAAADYLASTIRENRPDAEPLLGLLGHSRGGGMAILHAARDARIRALVTWAAISRALRFGPEMVAAWERGESVPVVNARTGQVLRLGRNIYDETKAHPERFDILDAARRVASPWLIAHGAGDDTVAIEEARALLEASRAGAATARLLEIPSTGHTFDAAHPFDREPEPLRALLNETFTWFDAHLRSRP